MKSEYMCIFIMLALSGKSCTLSKYDNQGHFKSLSGLCYELTIYIYIIYVCLHMAYIYIHTHSIYMYAYVCCILLIYVQTCMHIMYGLCVYV